MAQTPLQTPSQAPSDARDVAAPDTPALTICLVEKHPLAIRWMHWVNFPVLMAMVWSGFMIYWANSASGYTNEHQVYRIGIGSFTLMRLFPAWFSHLLRFEGHQARGLALHAFFMWFFMVNGLLYALYLGMSGQWRSIVPDRAALRAFWRTVWTEARGGKAQHPGRKYNAAQRVAYTLVLMMGAGEIVTGVAIWKPTTLSPLTNLLGGYETARWLHFWLTMGLCGFFLVHVLQVLRAGWNTLRGMIAGAEVVTISLTTAESESEGTTV